MVASSQTVQDFPKMFKGFSQQKGTRIEKLRHTVLHEERVNGTFLAIVSALLLKHFSHFLLKTQNSSRSLNICFWVNPDSAQMEHRQQSIQQQWWSSLIHDLKAAIQLVLIRTCSYHLESLNVFRMVEYL